MNRTSLVVLVFVLIPLLGQAVTGKLDQVVHWGGAFNCFAVNGPLVYLGNTATLDILDISKPNDLSWIGSAPLAQPAMDVKLSGELVLVGSSAGLQVFDVHESTTPRLLSTFSTPKFFNKMAVSGRIVYGKSAAGFHILDLGNPAKPVQLGFFAWSSTAITTAIEGNLFYFADGNRICILDVSDPARPVKKMTYNQPMFGCGFHGDRAYVYTGSSLTILDCSNPVTPTVQGTCPLNGIYIHPAIQLFNNLLLLLDQNGYLQVVDVSDPAQPIVVGSIHVAPTSKGGLVLDAGRVFVADPSTLMTVDLAVPTSPTVQTRGDFPSSPIALTLDGDLAYIADHADFLRVMTLADPLHPEMCGQVALPGHPESMVKAGSLVYLACGQAGLLIVDVGDPAHPRLLGQSNSQLGDIRQLALQGSFAYLAGSAGLPVLDISDPTSPTQVGLYLHASPDHWGIITRVKVQGDRAYVFNEDYGLEVLDLSKPAEPKLLASRYTPNDLADFDLVGSKLYVAEISNGLAIYDTNNPTTATLTGVYHPGDVYRVKLEGSLAYVAVSPGGLQLVDLSEPKEPRLLANIPRVFETSVKMANGYLYACGKESGLYIFHYQPDTEARAAWTLYDRY